MWPFSKIKKQQQEIDHLKAEVKRHEKPLNFGPALSRDEWSNLSQEDQIERMRKLDLILTLKKSGRWDYTNNCAMVRPKTVEYHG